MRALPLSVSADRVLVAEAQAGRSGALRKLIVAYRPLVLALAYKRRNYGVDLDDLEQEGNIALLRAVQKFDGDKYPNGFGTYAKWWVRSAMDLYVGRNWASVRPKHNGRHGGALALVYNTIADGLAPRSLTTTLGRSLCDHVGDGEPMIDDALGERQHRALLRGQIMDRMQDLPARDQEILKARWLREDDPELFDALAVRYGISKERVRQIELRALERIGAGGLVGRQKVADQVPA